MNRIITISRQFGSGGREVATRIAQKLSVPLFDNQIILKAVEESGISPEHFMRADEKRSGSFLFSLVSAHYGATTPIEMSHVISDDNLHLHMANAIKKLAVCPCVVLGRCGDDVLKELNPLKVFLCAETESRVARVCLIEGITEKAAAALIKKQDKARSNYYNFYTGKVWGEASNYDICLNTTTLSIDKTIEIICSIASL